jgi:hypothetical protein
VWNKKHSALSGVKTWSGANRLASANERRWTAGSFLAAGFALFLFVYNLGFSIWSTTLPSDGWMFAGILNLEEPVVIFTKNILGEPSSIQPGDKLLAINGETIQHLADAAHAFFRLQPPNWPDGTVLEYTLLRQGQTLSVEVPVRRLSFWQYFGAYNQVGISQWVQLVGGFFFLIVSLVVFLLRPSNRAAHALLLIGVTFGLIGVPYNSSITTFLYPQPPISIPFDGWTLGINASLMYLVLVFPHPKLPLRKYPRLTIALLYLTWPVAFNTAYLLNLDDRMGYLKAAFAIYPIQIVLLMGIAVVSLVHSAWKVRDPVGRSQFKWMLAGVFSFVFLGIGGWLVSAYLFPETMEEGNWLLTTIGWFLLPLCLAIAILRYRLFDIDLVIRRTLQYAVISGLLSLVYFGGVALLQAIVGGQSSPLIITITTLAIAALFNPLRRRVQDFIDRRFYRQKYDAEQALASFAAAARIETDLSQLCSQVLTTVRGTLQPEQVVIWLQPYRKENEKI